VWSCDVKMLSAHSSALHVAALVLQALKALRTHSLIFKVEISPSLLQIKPECPAGSLCTRDHHAGNLHPCQKPATIINIPKHDSHTYIHTYKVVERTVFVQTNKDTCMSMQFLPPAFFSRSHIYIPDSPWNSNGREPGIFTHMTLLFHRESGMWLRALY